MSVRRILFKVGFVAVAGVVLLAMGGPVSEAAAPPLLIDDSASATDCGKYTNKTASSNAVSVINTALTGQTILICPGTYDMNRIGALGALTITDKTLTIKRAVTSGPDSRPTLTLDPDASLGFNVTNSTLTIDGVVLDARDDTQSDFVGIRLVASGLTFKSSGLIGPDVSNSKGIASDNTGEVKVVALTVSASTISGYRTVGVSAKGPTKLNVSSSLLDATDGGRVASLHSANGVHYDGLHPDTPPTGSVSKSTFLHHYAAVLISDASKIKVTTNVMEDNFYGVSISANGSHNADGNTISGNNILSVPNGWTGIGIYDFVVTQRTVNKTVISKNTIVSAVYNAPGANNVGVFFSLSASSGTAVTATLSGNLLVGFSPATRVLNNAGNAVVVEKGTESMP